MARSWKDLLLSSGLPLEYSVGRLLAGISSWTASEYKYRRTSEDGSDKIFSVDVASTHINARDDVWLEMLVECKYRHDGTNWVFVPLESRNNDSAIISIDQCSDVGSISAKSLHDVLSPFSLCSKGVELLDKDANPKSIEQALQQLRYGVAPKVVDALNHQAGHWLGSISPVFLLVPVVVTTAALWRMRPDTSVEDVRAATEIADVCDHCPALVVEQCPDEMQHDYTVNVFDEQMDEDAFDRMNDTLVARQKGDAPGLVDHVARHVPSRFLVVEYQAFAGVAAQLHARVERADLLDCATPPG